MGVETKNPGVSFGKWKPIVRELLYWKICTSSGDFKSVGKNHPDSVAVPVVEISLNFIAMCHAESGREAFSCLVPPNMHMNSCSQTLPFPAS